MSPQVTVIVPFYNDGMYVHQSIQSIQKQSFLDWQLVVVNDGSNDHNTIKTIKAENYPKTKVLDKKNGGVSSARNFGIKNFPSEYILLLDADDLFDSTFLEKAVKILDSDKTVGVVSCDARFFLEDDFHNTLSFYHPKGGGLENFLLESNCIGCSLIRYQCWEEVGGYDEKLPSHEDWDFWIKVTKNGWMVYTIPEVLFHYRRSHKSKYQKNVHRKPEFVKRIVENNLDVYKEHVAVCLYEKEKEIRRIKEEYKDKIKKIKNSSTYLIGSLITYPYRIIKSTFANKK